ncbi:MAG: tRNA (adenosine(37)-N6)-threonylcarbamoyltransferase complex transferase subunit TsaD, partial [Oscillospiraceae bacterium]|nr:tRNA (adenosine(37)-N6)-threonylcarbamoyltransferase complex transferase subunit TsaD [Oscillospiraceae bacterium]
VINFVNSEKQKGNALNIPDIAASFQKTAMGVIIEKTIRAAKKYGLKTIAIGGGVAANSYLRENLSTRANDENIELIIPSKILCTDNGAMIAATGYMEYLKNPKIEGLAFEAYSRNDL